MNQGEWECNSKLKVKSQNHQPEAGWPWAKNSKLKVKS